MSNVQSEMESVTILLADDDEDDLRLIQDALKSTGCSVKLIHVEDGEELLEYLRQQGRYENPRTAPPPTLVLLDLNMPIKDGREALVDIKSDPRLRRIPVVVLTTSHAGDDIQFCYDQGANSFVTKPTSYKKLVHLMDIICEYWTQNVHPSPPYLHHPIVKPDESPTL